MSDSKFEEGRAKVYDDSGKTIVPAIVREAMGIEEGDTIAFRYVDGATLIQVVDEDDDE